MTYWLARRRAVLTALLSMGAFALGRAWPAAEGSRSYSGRLAHMTHVGESPTLQAPCPGVEPIMREADALSRELGRLQAELLKGQLYDAKSIGLPVEWPPELPELWREDSVERLLMDALGQSGSILALDCSEYPCLAVVAPISRAESVTEGQKHSSRVKAALERAGVTVRSAQSAIGSPQGGQLLLETLSFEAPGYDFPDKRRRFRIEELQLSADPAVAKILEGQADK